MTSELATGAIAIGGACLGAVATYFATSRLDARKFQRDRGVAAEEQQRKEAREQADFQRAALEALQSAIGKGFYAASRIWQANADKRVVPPEAVEELQMARLEHAARTPRVGDEWLVTVIAVAFDKIEACAFGWDDAADEDDQLRLYQAMFAAANFANHRIAEALRDLVVGDSAVGTRAAAALAEALELRSDPERLHAHNERAAEQLQRLFSTRLEVENQVSQRSD